MLILCSNGLSSDTLLSVIKEKTAGCQNAALVVTANHQYKENSFHVERCTEELQALGLSVQNFDLDTQPAEALYNYDVVEFIGGNPYYLLKSVRESNAAEVLKNIAEKKILIGWSAAVFVFGPTLELADMYTPEMNLWGMTDLRGIGLTDVEVLPHYDTFIKRFADFEEKCRQYEEKHNVNVIRISDGEGILIENQTVTIYKRQQETL